MKHMLMLLMAGLFLCSCGEDDAESPDTSADGDTEIQESEDDTSEADAETPKRITAPECLADPSCPFPILNAHRGLCGDEPENTIAAFMQCEQFSVPMFEIDLRQTQDGKIVLMHDSTVNRTTDGETRYPDRTQVSALTLEEFKALVISDKRCAVDPDNAPDRCYPATFAELLARTKDESVLFLDFKDGDPSLVASDILEAKAEKRVIFFDSDLGRLRAYRQAIPGGLVMPRAEYVEDYPRFLDDTNADLELLWIHGDPEHAASVAAMLKEKQVRLYFNLFTLSDLWFATAELNNDPKKKAEYEAKAKTAMEDAIASGGMGFGTEYAAEGAEVLYPNGFGVTH